MGESKVEEKEKAIASVPGYKILTYRTAKMRVIMQLSEIQYQQSLEEILTVKAGQ